MLFFEIDFLLFISVFLTIYCFLRGTPRISFILLASYIFYGWWDYRFLALLLISTLVDYAVGLKLENEQQTQKRKMLLVASLCTNLGILFFFKYFNFFLDSFYYAFNVSSSDRYLLEIALPPGISFYTFQTLSYTIDVYQKRFPAEKSLLAFSTYVAFFPQLIAGPIERPGKLLPQIKKEVSFQWPNIYVGFRYFLCGCFKKMFIADNLAKVADKAFAAPDQTTSIGLLIGAYCFALQIYCDFSGYSDMARGLAKCIGINLSNNFNLPYLSASLGEFWRRWHITLSYWLRDYVYIPLGGSRSGITGHIRNLLITFTLSGLWHGADWNFVLWGILHAVWITFELIARQVTTFRLPKILSIFITLNIVVLLWVLFRADSVSTALIYYKNLIAPTTSYFVDGDLATLAMLAFYSSPLVLFSLWQYSSDTLTPDYKMNNYVHASALGVILFVMIFLGAENGQQFIYFQF
ncbi:MBOAT family O-acyltransferase [Halodesulfovibrio marinisediminis]|uniref:D-alanyl-lipoteichoic acid acyltransferase DltB, MBOAT superfamily n=1 Tax=Halodesulfovibrio marinisediminis DSM 17456 TaxID=1121457 RepID=A0A1N6J635_9BACT|nr:MBOAT family O-acyltransferase [Halodesulfovibrio marinisediminis]SIO39693.1 D-alanyl-lipoteichoic acid acyltransferase DltB, MBOAT superfamily [Halodesulfovibrio marinisediminis DSM 17456]